MANEKDWQRCLTTKAKIPVIRSSICTGEQVAGFKDSSGKFEKLMLILDDKDLSEFLSRYQVEKTEIKREW